MDALRRYAVLVMMTGAAPAGAVSQEYQVDTRAPTNLVVFVSRASVEEFEGVTDRIDGYVALPTARLDSTAAGGRARFHLEVDLAGLDTGIGLRNRHMRDNYLEVSKFPYATYTGGVDHVDPRAGGGFRVLSSGVLTIHGVEREVSVPCDVTAVGSSYRAQCAFRVRLSDYDIEIPRVMFMKLANEVDLRLDFTVRPAQGGI